MDWLSQHVPIWLLGMLVFALLVAAHFTGSHLQRRRQPPAADELDSAHEGYVVSGVIGLLALLLGFTFALAVDRFETRRILVLQEANAIHATYLRAQTFDEPDRSRLSRSILQYADARIALGKSAGEEQTARLLGQSNALQGQMWEAALAAIAPRRDDVSASFMDAMSQAVEVGAERRAARQAHVPKRVFTILIIYMAASAAMMGHVMRRSWHVAVVSLYLLLTLSYVLILDIDDATSGGVRESQRPMEDLRALPIPS